MIRKKGFGFSNIRIKDRTVSKEIREESNGPCLNLNVGLSPKWLRGPYLSTESSPERPGREEYRYPDFGFADSLNSDKKSIWEHLVDHVSSKR